MVSLRLHITGQVQGVSFRVYTQQKARELGLAGFVQNRPDSSVVVEVHGPAAAVAKFVDWCRTGPPAAVVASVDASPIAPRSGADFIIR